VIQEPGRFQVTVDKGYLSVEANEAPLGKIFEEIGRQAGIDVESGLGSKENITAKLDRVPLEEGLKQLAKNISIFYVQDPINKTRRISRVVVLQGNNLGQSKIESTKVSTKRPIKDSGPAPRLDSFKFEFDPTKFTEKKGK
jgi:hypothetical protein